MTLSARLLTLISIFILSCSVSAHASDPYTQAYLKWDAGNYTEALEDFLEILNGPDADLYFNEIATLTGELYIVNEISEDGRNPVFSPDNRHFAWEENDSGFITTKIARISETGIEHLHTLEGRDILFSPDGSHGVIMRTNISSRMEELQQELNELLKPATDRQSSQPETASSMSRPSTRHFTG